MLSDTCFKNTGGRSKLRDFRLEKKRNNSDCPVTGVGREAKFDGDSPEQKRENVRVSFYYVHIGRANEVAPSIKNTTPAWKFHGAARITSPPVRLKLDARSPLGPGELVLYFIFFQSERALMRPFWPGEFDTVDCSRGISHLAAFLLITIARKERRA